jgi:hypothetical protein
MVPSMQMIEFDDLLACLEIESADAGQYRLPNVKMNSRMAWNSLALASWPIATLKSYGPEESNST